MTSEWFDVTRLAPCVICRHELKVSVEAGEQSLPWGGTVFEAGGNYGSTVFDQLGRGEYLRITVCDGCLRTVARNHPGVIRLVHSTRSNVVPPPIVTAWKPYEAVEDDDDDDEPDSE